GPCAFDARMKPSVRNARHTVSISSDMYISSTIASGGMPASMPMSNVLRMATPSVAPSVCSTSKSRSASFRADSSTARKEADLDLLVEQTLGATLGVAILSTFDIGIDAGIPPEAMVLEMYMSEEMETVWRAFRTEGFMRASNAHGP